ncbi:MAG: HNH endonuclease [Myxococcota bacterium]
MHDALLLNADFSPVGVVAWQRAVCLVLDHKVRIVEGYAGRRVRAPNFEMEWPAVVHLVRYVRIAFSPPLNRMSVLARDRFSCQYCGLQPRLPRRPDTGKLTLDHVVPRAAALNGRVRLPWSGRDVPLTSWQNLVTACGPCNHKKGHRSLVESGFELRRIPRRPRPQDAIRVALARISVPAEWRNYLPLDE